MVAVERAESDSAAVLAAGGRASLVTLVPFPAAGAGALRCGRVGRIDSACSVTVAHATGAHCRAWDARGAACELGEPARAAGAVGSIVAGPANTLGNSLGPGLELARSLVVANVSVGSRALGFALVSEPTGLALALAVAVAASFTIANF